MSATTTPSSLTAEEHLRRQLADLIDEKNRYDGDDPYWAIAATTATGQATEVAASEPARDRTAPPLKAEVPEPGGAFLPRAPRSLAEAGLSDSAAEALVTKYLLNHGAASGVEIADQLKLPLSILGDFLANLKQQQLVVYKSAGLLTDYVYQLTELGAERARRYSAQCSYFGSAPVGLDDYTVAVREQSLVKQRLTLADVERAFEDLLLNEEMLSRLGEAASAGRGLFLHGPPGNGKTCIATRITRAFGSGIWIPRTLSVSGEIIRLYDPTCHHAIPLPEAWQPLTKTLDRRWVFISRPTVVAGGEMTLSNLELTASAATGICEAPLQLKSNCGTLVIDDFGRQRVAPGALLNRWIVPLECGYDYLDLPSGRKVQVPFDQLTVFSTNLEPRDLVDEAFLRRIPYKVDVVDPTEDEFVRMFRTTAASLKIEFVDSVYDHLLERHYRTAGRALRFCHPRDLLLHVRNFCLFRSQPLSMSVEAIDRAAQNYFGVL